MTPERWSRVKEIFSAAMEEPPDRRETFLNEACPDESLRAEVRRLVQAEDSPTLESPLSRIVTPRGSVPAVIGRYRIVRLLGEGGMGAVYEAEQDQPRRRVALKAIRPGLVSPALLRRFEHETQALGLLSIPESRRFTKPAPPTGDSGCSRTLPWSSFTEPPSCAMPKSTASP